MGERLVFDIEADGFKPTVIFCLGIYCLDTDTYEAYVGDDVPIGLARLANADLVIGHYVKGYDLPVIERLTEGFVVIPTKNVVDTVDESRRLFPALLSHKLANWGEVLGYPKLEWHKFDKFYPEMLPYMARDVEINVHLYRFFVAVEQENLLAAS